MKKNSTIVLSAGALLVVSASLAGCSSQDEDQSSTSAQHSTSATASANSESALVSATAQPHIEPSSSKPAPQKTDNTPATAVPKQSPTARPQQQPPLSSTPTETQAQPSKTQNPATKQPDHVEQPSSQDLMDVVAKNAGLGTPKDGKTWKIKNGSTAKDFTRGVVVRALNGKTVAMSHPVFRVWDKNFKPHGNPIDSTGQGESIETRFEQDTLVQNDQKKMVTRSDITMTDRDILVIGDSQAHRTPQEAPQGTWIMQGVSQAGYNPIRYARGGVGYVADYSGEAYGSYSQGVNDNWWTLPNGSPKAIYINGSGNDTYLKDIPQVQRSAHATIQQLKKMYPHSQIIAGGVISQNIPSHAPRHQLNEVLREVARSENVTFLDLKNWVTIYHSKKFLRDAYHFKAEGQNYMAPFFKQAILQSLR